MKGLRPFIASWQLCAYFVNILNPAQVLLLALDLFCFSCIQQRAFRDQSGDQLGNFLRSFLNVFLQP